MFFDKPLQALFFDPLLDMWSVSGEQVSLRLLFYSIPKGIFGTIVALLFVRAFLIQKGGRSLIVATAIVLSPILVALLKAATGVECPKDLLLYGGMQGELPLLHAMSEGTGRCFPGGHVSAGFGLYALLSLIPSNRRGVAFVGITIVGHLMGFYQIARGYHFLSHNLATMGISYSLYLFNEILIQRFEGRLNLLLDIVRRPFAALLANKSFE
ncbi:MAG: phosphatase PAP2 family protein [Chlamydiia bacterium]